MRRALAWCGIIKRRNCSSEINVCWAAPRKISHVALLPTWFIVTIFHEKGISISAWRTTKIAEGRSKRRAS